MITTMNLFVVNMAASDLLTTVLVIPVDILELLQKASGQFIIVLQQDLCYAKLCFQYGIYQVVLLLSPWIVSGHAKTYNYSSLNLVGRLYL